MNGDSDPLLLKKADWPEVDRIAWEALFANDDIIDGRGPCFRWSDGSRRKREQSYSRWLGFLKSVGMLSAPACVSDRANTDTISEFITCEQKRNKMRTVHLRVEDLWFLFSALDPDRDWSWLREIVLRLRAVADIGYLKPLPGVSAGQIFSWAKDRLKAVGAEVGPPDLDRAVRFRDGLQVGLLISTPLRRRTFVAVEIGRHLRNQGDGFVLSFGQCDMKDRKRHDFPLHPHLSDPMRRYLDVYRPLLLQGTKSDRLWITARGCPLCADSFYGHFCDLTLREFGERLGPHAFRHVAATSIAMCDPEHVGIIADVLGHSSLEMAHKHYIHAGNFRAVSRYQELASDLKRAAGRRRRSP